MENITVLFQLYLDGYYSSSEVIRKIDSVYAPELGRDYLWWVDIVYSQHYENFERIQKYILHPAKDAKILL